MTLSARRGKKEDTTMNLREITDFNAPELDVYARLTENQLVNRADPATPCSSRKARW